MTSGDYLQGFLRGTRTALYQNDRESLTISIPTVSPYVLGALIALYERAVGFYGSLVNVNAYHQPGVEAGKKAATAVLELQKKVQTVLSENKGSQHTAAELATKVGADAEDVFHVLDPPRGELAGLEATPGASPGRAQVLARRRSGDRGRPWRWREIFPSAARRVFSNESAETLSAISRFRGPSGVPCRQCSMTVRQRATIPAPHPPPQVIPPSAAATAVPWERVERFVGQFTHDIRNGLNALELQLTFLGEISTDPEAAAEVKQLRATLGEITRQLQAVKLKTGVGFRARDGIPGGGFPGRSARAFRASAPAAAGRVRWSPTAGRRSLADRPRA